MQLHATRAIRRLALGWAILLASVLALPTTAWANICGRTPEVRDAILDVIQDNTPAATCDTVTDTQLAGVEYLYIRDGYSSPSIVPSDFAGLTGLIELVISNSRQLTTLPANAFSELAGLTALELLSLSNSPIHTVHPDAFDGLTFADNGRGTIGLSECEIKTLHPDTFTDVTHLAEIFLGRLPLKALKDGIFAGLSDLTALSLAFNRIENLAPTLFADLDGLTSLDLAGNRLSTLPAGIFDDLSELTSLTLSSNDIADLPAGIFDTTTKLEKLDLQNNRIESLHEDLFAGLAALERLDLSGNALTAIPEALFTGLTALERLILSSNQLTTLPAALFAGLTSLERLYLYDNDLTTLPADLFNGLTALSTLELDSNQLTTLDADLFAGLTALSTLRLHDNQLTTLDADLFADLTALSTLRLHDNQLTILPADLFAGLTALSTLRLHDNQLRTLDAALFTGLTALRTLELDSNQLTTLEAALFTGLTALQRIGLSNNDLTALPAALFAGLDALSSLNLDENALGSLPTNVFEPLDDSLTDLYLRDNVLTALPAGVFAGLEGLQRLDLSCNDLTTLDPTDFNPFATTLIYLDLDANDFSPPLTTTDFPMTTWTALEALHLDNDASACHPASDVGLSGLTTNYGPLLPWAVERGEAVFVIYSLTVGADVSELTVTPTLSNPRATIGRSFSRHYVYDNDDSTPGIQVDLTGLRESVGWDVRAENLKDGFDDKGHYLLDVRRERPPASNALLRDLAFSDLELQPGFDILTFDYRTSVPSTPASTTVTATPLDPDLDPDTAVVIKHNGVKVSGVILLAGDDVITIEVTAEDGVTTQTYTVTMGRTDFTNPVLQSAMVSGDTVIMTYNEPLLEDGCPDGEMLPGGVVCPENGMSESPQTSLFRLREGMADPSDQEGYPTDVGVRGSTVTLRFDEIDTTNGVELQYTSGIFPIRDEAGNEAAELDWLMLPYGRPAGKPDAPRNLRATAGDEQVRLRWDAPADDGGAAIEYYEYEIDSSGDWISTGGTSTSQTVSGLDNGQAYTFRVRARNSAGSGPASASSQSVTPMEGAPPPPSPPTPPRPPSGGGGGPACAADLHGNTAAQATGIALTTETAGVICPAADVDYFTLTAPGRGLVFVDTTGGGQFQGTLWQNEAVLATGPTGRGPDARLGALVEAGAVVVAVAGQGGATGEYALVVTFSPGYLENPGHNSFQSGIGVISGWVCEADAVEIEMETAQGAVHRYEAGYGTARADTAVQPDGTPLCGDTDNGFGLLFNWNLLGEGDHAVVAWVDGVELGRATVTVTTVGEGEEEEFLRGVEGACVVADFPMLGETVRLEWQQNKQNFVITRGTRPAGTNMAGVAGEGYLENPGPNSFQSGIGVISGWVCEAEGVEIAIETERGETERQVAAYGTERLDTAARRKDGTPLCGDTDNGFGLLFNWNRLGAGEHTVVAYVDDVELGRATVRVTTVGAGAEEEFLRGAEGECVVADFPMLGETVTLAWQQNSQNFVITDAE